MYHLKQFESKTVDRQHFLTGDSQVENSKINEDLTKVFKGSKTARRWVFRIFADGICTLLSGYRFRFFLELGMESRKFFYSRVSNKINCYKEMLFHGSSEKFLRFGVCLSSTFSKIGFHYVGKNLEHGENTVTWSAHPCTDD